MIKISTSFLISLVFMVNLLSSCSSNQEIDTYKQGNIKVFIEQGEEWEHDFPLFLGISKKNTPQIAIWIEDTCGNYISTVYVTKRIATQSWIMSKGSRRMEALPHWCYSRGVQYEDGLYSPTKDKPIPDAITGATPKGSFKVAFSESKLNKFILKVEINHSTDFNNSYPKLAQKGDKNYTGGEEGSGQPALIYSALIDLASEKNEFTALLIGHSSPDGSSGEINSDLSGITTAINIVKKITVSIEKI